MTRDSGAAAHTGLVLFDADGTPTGDQLRRRRAAAARLEPLEDGRRDPLAPRRRKPLPGRHLRVELGRRSAWLYDDTSDRGPRGDRVCALLESTGREQRRQWDERRHAWSVPLVDLDDLLAHAEYRGRWSVELIDPVPDP